MAWYPKIVTVKKDGTTGSEYPFPKGRCSVGGITGCDIHIRGAGSSHCLFIVDKNKQAHVVNVTGTADVQRNGEGVDNESFLSHGDVVQIGSRQFRFEWVEKRKKGDKSSEVAAASHQPKAAGDARESSALQNEVDNEANPVQQSNGTPGTCTPTTYSFDQSLFKTPRIPPEMFVSPLSASYSDQEYNNGGEDGPRTDAVGNSQLISSSSSTPLIDEPRIRALHSSTSSTPLLDEPRTRTTRSRSSLAGMVNSPLEQEQPIFQERQSGSPLKRRSQSFQTTVEERSSKLRRSDSYGPARCTSLAYHCDANGQSGPSSRSSSAEDCAAHIEVSAHPGTAAKFFAASTPVTRTARNGRVRSNKTLKDISFLHQEKKTGFTTPGSQSCYPNGNATMEESFLDSPSLSRRALRSSQASLFHASLSASADSLGLESLFKTPNHTGSASKNKKEVASFIIQDMSNSSLGTKRAPKRLSHVNESSQQSQANNVAASSASSRSRHSLEKNTNGTRTPSDQCTRSTRAKSSLGQSSECTTSVRTVSTAAETVDSLEGSNSEGHSGTITLCLLEQEEGVSAKKTGSKHAMSIISTLILKESPGDKSVPEVSGRGARSSITNSAVASLTWSELCSEDVSQDIVNVTTDDLRAARSTRFSRTPNHAPAANTKSKKPESPKQEGAVASEKGNEEGGVLGQAVRDVSKSDQESLEHMGVVKESPRTTVSKQSGRRSASKKVYIEDLGKETGMQSPETTKIEQTTQCSSETLENNVKSALEKSTLPNRSGRFSHIPTSKEVREEVSELETAGAPSPSKAPRSKRTLLSRNANEEPNHMTLSTLSPGHMALENVDVVVKGSIRTTRSARFSRELVSAGAIEKASEHEAGGMSATLKSSGAKEAPVPKKEIEGMSKQKTLDTPRSLKALAARQVPRSCDVNEDEIASTLISKRMSLQNMGVALEESSGCTRSTRSSTSLYKRTSLEYVDAAPEKCFEDTRSTRHSHTPSKCAKAGMARQKTVDTWTSKILDEEKTPDQLASERATLNSMDLAEGESSGRITRCSPLSLSKKVSADPLEHKTVGPRSPLKPGGVKQVQLSQDVMEQTSGHQTVGTPKSLKASGVEQTLFSMKIKEDEDSQGQQDIVGAATDEYVTFGNTDSSVDASDRTRSIKASRSSYEEKLNVKAKKEATVDSNQKPSSKAKQTQASKRVAAAEETGELEKVGVSPSKHIAFDNSDVTVAAFGRVTRAARSRYVETLKSADVMTPEREVEGRVSPLKDLGTVHTPVSNKELGVSSDLEAVDTKKSSRKVLRAKTTRSTRKVNSEEEVPELEAAGPSASKCSPAKNVHVLSEEPARSTRNTRGRRARGSKKDSVEAPEEKASDQPQSAKATGAKRTQGSRKACKKDDETPQDVAGSLVMSSASQGKDATSDKELQGEVSPTKEATITRKTRGKRKLDLKEKAVTEEHSTAEEVIGIVAVKRGRRQQRVASVEDAPQESDPHHSNNTEQAICPKNTRSSRAAASAKKAQRGKAVIDDALASLNIDSATVEPASSSDKTLATASESKRSKRKVVAVKVDPAQTATEETPRKNRGRRAKALETVLEYADDDKHGVSQETAREHSEEVPPPRRTRRKV